jgi:polyhydroxybutyrate depolymerase
MFALPVVFSLGLSVCVNEYPEGHFDTVTLKTKQTGALEERTFLLFIPPGVPVGVPVPLLVDFHGYSSNPHYVNLLENSTIAADKYKWILALPYGTASKDSPTCCPAGTSKEDCEGGQVLDKGNPCCFNAGTCCGTCGLRKTDDIAFTELIVEHLVEKACVNPKNVFATGFSNGGMMTNRVGCELSHLFKGIAPHAGNIKTSSCKPTTPVSWVSFCGSQDSACKSDFDRTFAEWGEHNTCEGDAEPTFQSATTNCTAWRNCKARDTSSGSPASFVEMCWIEGLAHCWSGHERPSATSSEGRCEQPPTNVDATEYLFDRFSTILED